MLALVVVLARSSCWRWPITCPPCGLPGCVCSGDVTSLRGLHAEGPLNASQDLLSPGLGALWAALVAPAPARPLVAALGALGTLAIGCSLILRLQLL